MGSTRWRAEGECSTPAAQRPRPEKPRCSPVHAEALALTVVLMDIARRGLARTSCCLIVPTLRISPSVAPSLANRNLIFAQRRAWTSD